MCVHGAAPSFVKAGAAKAALPGAQIPPALYSWNGCTVKGASPDTSELACFGESSGGSQDEGLYILYKS